MRINSLSNPNVSFGVLHFINNEKYKKSDSVNALLENADEASLISAKNMLAEISQLEEDFYVNVTPVRTTYRQGVRLNVYTDSKAKDRIVDFSYENGAGPEQHEIWAKNDRRSLNEAVAI